MNPGLIPDISVVIITRNEATNIKRCLDSLQWVKEVIIVDSGSTDNTLEIVSTYKNVKVIETDWSGYSENKRKGTKTAVNDWVFWVDADEEVTKELMQELASLKVSEGNFYAYDLPRKTFFLNEWVRHTGWYPGRVIRLFNKKYCDFNDNILHESVLVPEGKTGHLKSDLLHYSYQNLYQYFDKMNYYGKYGAEELLRKGKKFSIWQLLFNPCATFIKFYFFKKGFLDGKKGFIISVGSAFSNFIKYTNFYYLSRQKKI